MEPSERILRLLRLATTSLGSTGPLYREVEGLDNDAMLMKLGEALTKLFDIDQAVCKLHPDLTADQWKLITQDKEAFDAEFEKLACAMEAEEAGNFVTAKKLFTELNEGSQIEDNRVRSQAGLYRINEKS